jgi:hypothetical protein
MAFDGYIEYQRREYCRVVHCPVQTVLDEQEQGSDTYEKVRLVCQTGCLQTSHAFHKYLIEAGYIIIRPESKV